MTSTLLLALTVGNALVGGTVAGNVPLNRRLDREAAGFWPLYRRTWTGLNTLRGVAHLAGVVPGGLALVD
jgi:hypothetical protein